MPTDPNSLLSCPGSPNCVRESRTFALAPATLFERAQQALQAMNPAELSVQPSEHRAQAVFRIFFFKDDVEIAVTPESGEAVSGESVLHIRSASRAGQYDFGVNRRRVRRFFDTLDEQTDG